MKDNNGNAVPPWAVRFLDALRDGHGVRKAARLAGVGSSTPYHLRGRSDDFRAAWDAAQPVDDRRRNRAGPAPRREATRIQWFLDELAQTSNVATAAAVAGLAVGKVYRLRRTDPEFARRWYAALAEGYDNLEMDLLARLRDGRMEDTDAEGNKRKFDFAVALRCLAAHRESVAREKGRRTLAEEAATIEAINAKIDALRARAREGGAQVRKSKQAIARRSKPDGEE